MRIIVLSVGAVLTATTAQAHVALSPPNAPAGSYYAGVFRVGHGCAGKATTALRIEIPREIESSRPRAVPGWKLEIEREGDRVTAVTWRGKLEDERFEEFGLFMKLPPAGGPFYFPAIQTCGKDQAQWIQVPSPGEDGRPLAQPAPKLDLGSAPAATTGHNH